MATDKIRLNSGSVKTTDAKTVTEAKEPEVRTTVSTPKVTTDTEATYSPFRKVDGSVDQAAVNEFNTNYRDPLANAYDIDPATGRYKGDVGALLGFDPDKYKAEQEAKARLERFKQKEAGWRNALGVVTDIATAAAGGNVYKRDKDEIAKKAGENADKANLTVQGLGKAVDDAVKGRELTYEQERQKTPNQYIKDFAVKVKQQQTQGGDQQTTTSGGGKVTTTTGGKEVTNRFREVTDGNGASGSGHGRVNNDGTVTFKVRLTDDKGKTTGYQDMTVDKQSADAYRNLFFDVAQKYISQIEPKIADEKPENPDNTIDPEIRALRTELIEAGLYNPAETDPHKRWNTTPERFYSFPYTKRLEALDTEVQKLWKKSKEYNGKDFVFRGTYTKPKDLVDDGNNNSSVAASSTNSDSTMPGIAVKDENTMPGI